MKNIFLILLINLLAVAANATGGTFCQVDDKNVNLDVSLKNGRFYGSPIASGSSVKLQIKKTAFPQHSIYTFDKNEFVNQLPYWTNFDGMLNLGAIISTFSNGSTVDVFLTIQTEFNKRKNAYVGNYKVLQSITTVVSDKVDMAEVVTEGKITCKVD